MSTRPAAAAPVAAGRRLLRGLRSAWSATVGRALALVLIGLIRSYQLVISPLTPPSCRFYPSCSAYALGSVRRHGAVKGAALAGWRLLRCNPWNDGGLDPVPDRGAWRPGILPDGTPRDHAAADGRAAPAGHGHDHARRTPSTHSTDADHRTPDEPERDRVLNTTPLGA